MIGYAVHLIICKIRTMISVAKLYLSFTLYIIGCDVRYDIQTSITAKYILPTKRKMTLL